MANNYQVASDVLGEWRDDIYQGRAPTFYPVGDGALARMEIGPGLITMFGGAPGAGKSAFVTQATLDAMRLTTDLRAVIVNVEMNPKAILDRQLARLSGIDSRTIRYRRFKPEHAARIETAMNTLEPLTERIAFVRPPFDLDNVADTADDFGGDLLIIDYIQRVRLRQDKGDDNRGSVNIVMDLLRKFADAGRAVVVVAAVSRTKDSKGRVSNDGGGLNLASFRESSELEFGADDCFMIVKHPKDDAQIILKHSNARNGEAKDNTLTFDKRHQQFTPVDDGGDVVPFPPPRIVWPERATP